MAAPFQTAQKLVNSLARRADRLPRAGTYAEDVTLRHGGTAGAPMTLTSYPGQTATILGRLYVAEGADYTTITGLDLDGANPPQMESPTIDANHVTFSYDDITNDHTGICFGIGSATWGWATGTLITHDRVHDCGAASRDQPPARLLHRRRDRHDDRVEPDLRQRRSRHSAVPRGDGTTIDHNIIDGNGEGILIAGADGVASSYTNVYDNIISNATERHDVESYWPAGNPVGVGNTVHDNCLWGGREGTIDTSSGGYTASNNLTVNPEFVNEAAPRLRAQSEQPVPGARRRCAGRGGWHRAPVQPPANATNSTPPPASYHRHGRNHDGLTEVAAQAEEEEEDRATASGSRTSVKRHVRKRRRLKGKVHTRRR